jgi:hypothetical protein
MYMHALKLGVIKKWIQFFLGTTYDHQDIDSITFDI